MDYREFVAALVYHQRKAQRQELAEIKATQMQKARAMR